MPSWMLRQLDYATRAHHVPADAGRLALFGHGVTRERYLDFLSRLYSFEAPIETRWKKTLGFERVIDVAQRVRTPTLLADLTALGVNPELLPGPTFVGVEQALGWMYVVERGRRLNNMLHHHLARRLPREVTLGGNYLLVSSPSGLRWQQLGTALDKVAYNSSMADQIINAAQRAFRTLRLTPVVTDKRAA